MPIDQDMHIHVAIAINHRFVPHAAAMIASILHNKSDEEHVTIHVMYCQLTPSDMARLNRLEQLAPDACRIEFYWINRANHKDFIITTHLSIETYFRLQMPELFADLNRIIYLDVDLLVRTSLAEIWHLDLSGNLVAVVGEHEQVALEYAALGMNPGQRFNAGVMVCDLAAMRNEPLWDAYQQAMALFRDVPDVSDQTLLNHVMAGRALLIAPRWNHCAFIYRHFLRFESYSQQDIVVSITDPAIVHFKGHRKPWQMRRDIHLYAHEYWRYLTMTPWKWQCWRGVVKKLFLKRKTAPESTYEQLLKTGLLPGCIG